MTCCLWKLSLLSAKPASTVPAFGIAVIGLRGDPDHTLLGATAWKSLLELALNRYSQRQVPHARCHARGQRHTQRLQEGYAGRALDGRRRDFVFFARFEGAFGRAGKNFIGGEIESRRAGQDTKNGRGRQTTGGHQSKPIILIIACGLGNRPAQRFGRPAQRFAFAIDDSTLEHRRAQDAGERGHGRIVIILERSGAAMLQCDRTQVSGKRRIPAWHRACSMARPCPPPDG